MTKNQYITYQKFSDYTTASEFGTLFKDNQIDYIIEDTSLQFDSFFSSNEPAKEYSIKIKPDEFIKADNLLLQNPTENPRTIGEDYYLVHFTNEELYNVIAKQNEWNEFDFQLAQKLLKERGAEIRPETIEELKKQNLIELSKPLKLEKGWIYIGYISAILGGLFGILIGWHIYTYKKLLPDGGKIYHYEEFDRKNGKTMLVIGAITFSVFLIIRMIN
ncbi:hypothetical protein TH53_11080 [Pedobacter lusitanus]|uniref:Uncharacterized protein n=1 Tax=Pedobacter lusitanus TaxID=1503925 RepID=A0A0D0FXD4_9SPHI|nr:hypothetical protein [Pedobacter lusitanus]KIO77169.1 hypothetical protein TH53_11080 [Pedobacter lusitanus]